MVTTAEETKSMEIPPHSTIAVMVLPKEQPIVAMDVKLLPLVMMIIVNDLTCPGLALREPFVCSSPLLPSDYDDWSSSFCSFALALLNVMCDASPS
jgi:hypothetical protein